MKKIKEYILITIGIVLLAFSLEIFMAPNKIAAGGVTGIAIIINSIFPNLSLGLLTIIMNIILFIVGFLTIGNKFGAKTIYASLSLSGMLWVMEKFGVSNIILTKNLFLASIFGTFLSGIGMGIVFNQNASTGGTDILAKILNKYFHLDIGKSLLIVDFIITLFGGAIFGADLGMYALLCVIINGFAIDNVVEGLNTCKEVLVVSSCTDEIKKFIIENMDRGCTTFKGNGGYSNREIDILYTVISRKEFIKLKNFIMKIDPNAFITVSNTHEVLGEGFKNILGDE
ncbi:MAG: YitT family protein [Bacillota bacterium]|nr:YitT family protein [Bacillota bacterium]